MWTSSLLPLTLIFVIFTLFNSSDSRWICNPCVIKDECEREPIEFCMWGEAKDSCKRRVCAKGPGEQCGGPLGILGQCGEGMMCSTDQKCHGCSTQTFQCHL